MSTTVETALNVATLIDDFLSISDETDPAMIAAKLAEDIPEDALRDALRQALPSVVHRRIMIRNAVQTRAVHSKRWERVGEELMRRRIVEVGGKFLRDLTRDEVLHVVERHRQLAEHHIHSADAFGRLAALMKRKRAKTVGELAERQVAEVFNA